MVTLQFPDPWVSPKHRKRQTASPAVADALARHLPLGARVYVSSDVPAVLWAAVENLQACGGGGALSWHRRPWRGGSKGNSPKEAAEADGGAPRPPSPASELWTDAEGLLLASPVGGGKVFSERDVVCEDLWRQVYRVLFSKVAEPPQEAPSPPPAQAEGLAKVEEEAGKGEEQEEGEIAADSSLVIGYAADDALSSSKEEEADEWTDSDRGEQPDPAPFLAPRQAKGSSRLSS